MKMITKNSLFWNPTAHSYLCVSFFGFSNSLCPYSYQIIRYVTVLVIYAKPIPYLEIVDLQNPIQISFSFKLFQCGSRKKNCKSNANYCANLDKTSFHIYIAIAPESIMFFGSSTVFTRILTLEIPFIFAFFWYL